MDLTMLAKYDFTDAEASNVFSVPLDLKIKTYPYEHFIYIRHTIGLKSSTHGFSLYVHLSLVPLPFY